MFFLYVFIRVWDTCMRLVYLYGCHCLLWQAKLYILHTYLHAYRAVHSDSRNADIRSALPWPTYTTDTAHCNTKWPTYLIFLWTMTTFSISYSVLACWSSVNCRQRGRLLWQEKIIEFTLVHHRATSVPVVRLYAKTDDRSEQHQRHAH